MKNLFNSHLRSLSLGLIAVIALFSVFSAAPVLASEDTGATFTAKTYYPLYRASSRWNHEGIFAARATIHSDTSLEVVLYNDAREGNHNVGLVYEASRIINFDKSTVSFDKETGDLNIDAYAGTPMGGHTSFRITETSSGEVRASYFSGYGWCGTGSPFVEFSSNINDAEEDVLLFFPQD